MKKANKKQVNNEQVNNNGCQHVQLGGMAYYDAKQYFLYCPQESGVNKVPRFRSMGVAQQMPDGTFDFVVQHRLRTQSELIKKLAHGRLSKTKDGAIQLTLKVFCHEGLNIAQTLTVESAEGADALVDYQLKREVIR